MDNISKHKFFTPIELKAVVVGIVGEMALVYNQIMIKSFIIGIITSSLSWSSGSVRSRQQKK